MTIVHHHPQGVAWECVSLLLLSPGIRVQSQADDFLISERMYHHRPTRFFFCHLSTVHIRRRTRNNPIDLGWSDAITETPPPRSKLITWTDTAHTTGKREACKQNSFTQKSLIVALNDLANRRVGDPSKMANQSSNLLFIPHESSQLSLTNSLVVRSIVRNVIHPFVRSFVCFDGCCFSMFRLLWKPILWTPDTRLESEVYTNDWTTSRDWKTWLLNFSLQNSTERNRLLMICVSVEWRERKLCNRPFSLSSLSLLFLVVHTNIIKGILWDSIRVGKRVPLPSTY